MFLRSIKSGLWTIYEACEEDGTSPLLQWKNSLNKKYQASFARLFAIIKRISDENKGPILLQHDISHEVNKPNSIYELIAGDLRVLWFYSEFKKKVIICGCQHLKSGQKVNKHEIKRIIKIKKDYLSAYLAGKITYFDEEGGKL